ncbi:MAG: bifunctional 2-methylcitrate dehydratase/aconitate hydratase [Chloroflexi bacterium]|nr:bifunctional 2-methylcitrate dehydratase/aconitate hydratase [Chloroflexota bacterium]
MANRYDDLIAEIAAYACQENEIGTEDAYDTARLALMDSVGCALLALGFPACRDFITSDDASSNIPGGVPIPGTAYAKTASQAAFDITTAIRWLDFNDTWLANEWGHPSDNFGAILAAADSFARTNQTDFRMREVFELAIRAYEIQGVLALDNAFNRVGIDHVLLVKVASAAVTAAVFSSGNEETVSSAVSHAWLDATLRTYRHAPNTNARKSWAAGDAASRGLTLGTFATRGMPGVKTALTAPTYGFQDVWFEGRSVTMQRDLASYVMENVLFKVKYPAEFHGQTAVEAAVALHPQVFHRLPDVKTVEIKTQEPAIRIIDKRGSLNNPADRDHCIQYMTAVALIKGNVTSDDYEEDGARDSRINNLREKMVVTERRSYSVEYLDPDRRSIANAIQVHFNDGSCTEEIEVRYPIGHRTRRPEAIPLLGAKFLENLRSTYGDCDYSARVQDLFRVPESLDEMSVTDFMDALGAIRATERTASN